MSTTLALLPCGDRRARAGSAAPGEAGDSQGAANLAGQRHRVPVEWPHSDRLHTVGPLFGARIGFDQQHIVVLMACVSLGGLFLQWPIGHFSTRSTVCTPDRLGVGSSGGRALAWAHQRMPFALLALLFGVFGGLRKVSTRWASRTPMTAPSQPITWPCPRPCCSSGHWVRRWAHRRTYAIQLVKPSAFFVYVFLLTLAFTVFAVCGSHAAKSIASSSRARTFSPTRRRRRRSMLAPLPPGTTPAPEIPQVAVDAPTIDPKPS